MKNKDQFYSTDEFVSTFKLEAFEINQSWQDEEWSALFDLAKDEKQLNEEDARDFADTQLNDIEFSMFQEWQTYVENNMELLLKEVKLKFEKHPKKDEYKIIPLTSWKESASLLVDIINGTGPFWFNNEKELMQQNSCISYKDTVLSHLSWLKYQPEVFGDCWPKIKLEYRH